MSNLKQNRKNILQLYLYILSDHLNYFKCSKEAQHGWSLFPPELCWRMQDILYHFCHKQLLASVTRFHLKHINQNDVLFCKYSVGVRSQKNVWYVDALCIIS